MKKTAILSIVLLLGATVATAQMMGGGGRMGPGGTVGSMLGMVIVANDGTVLVQDDDSLVAYTSTGTKAWAYTAAANARIHHVDVAGNLVVFPSTAATQRTMVVPSTSEVVALNLASGSVAWKKTFDGVVMQLTPAANQVYAVVVKSDGTRTLVALSQSGATLWTIAL